MSDDEVFNENGEATVNLTYVKAATKAATKAPTNVTYVASKVKHPPYTEMVREAVFQLGTRNAVSKAKMAKFIKDNYGLEEVSALWIKKAIQTGLENKILENTTASGASGSFKLSVEYREIMKKEKALKVRQEKDKLKKQEKKEKEVEKEKEKSTTSKSKATKSKDDMDVVTKKPPKGKENKKQVAGKENKKPSSEKGTQKVLKEKMKTLKKANSTGSMKKRIAAALPPEDDEVVPSTSGSRQGKKRAKK